MDIDDIISKMPYNSYEDLIYSILGNKSTLTISRNDCAQIAGIKHPNFSFIGMFLGSFISTIFFIFFCITIHNYWYLLLVPINFVINMLIGYIPQIKRFISIALLLNFFVLKSPIIYIVCFDFMAIAFFYSLWWGITITNAVNEMKFNKEAFLWSWNRFNISIEDCYGNIYNKATILTNFNDLTDKDISKQKTIISDENKTKYVQLVDIIMQGLGTSDIDETIDETLKFYKDNGVNIENMNFTTNKYEILVQIIMQALGTDDIDDAINKAREFYTENGIDIKEN